MQPQTPNSNLTANQQGFYNQLSSGGKINLALLTPSNPDYGDITTAMNAYTQSNFAKTGGAGTTTSADANQSETNLNAQQAQIKSQLAQQQTTQQNDPNGPYAPSLNTGPNTPGYTNLSLNPQSGSTSSSSFGPSNPNVNQILSSNTSASSMAPITSTGPAAPQTIPGGTSSTPPTGNLQPGMTGDSVKQLQQYLVSKGVLTQAQMDTGPGIYGPQTQAAVEALQKQLGVDTSGGGAGYFGPLTQAALSKSPVGASTPTGTNVSSTTGTGSTSGTSQSGTGTSSGTTGAFGPGNMTIQQAFQDYKNAQNFSPQYLADQSALMNLTGGTTVFNANAESQPISNTFISGQEAQQLKNVNAAAVPLQTRLAIDQAQRQAAIDTASTEMGLTSTSVPYGASNTNLLTGQTNSSGLFGTSSGGAGINPATGLPANATTAQQLGYLSGQGITVDKNNAPFLLAALQSGSTAQDIINNQANTAGTKSAATTGNAAYTNPLTGERVYPKTTIGSGGTTGGGGTSPSPTTQSGNTYTVQSGDIFHQIALNNSMTNAQLQALNPQITDPSKITPGQKINLAPANMSVSSGSSAPQSNAPSTLPAPTSYAQKSFAQDFTSGTLASTINAQNTAVGHLTAAFDLAQQMQNFALQPANAGKNFLSTAAGKAAVDNYNLAHTLSSSELSAAYGNDTGGERSLTAALGSSKSSPEQLKGFVQTSAALLSSKILSNVQQYKTAYGQNSPINLSWFISPQNQQALSKVGIIMKMSGNDVGAYQVQPDGSAKKI